MVTQTSIQAYKELIEEEQINPMQRVVLYTISQNQPLTDLEISDMCGYDINVVTARRNELYEKNLICSSGLKYNRTGKQAISWKLGTHTPEPTCLSETQLDKLMKKLINANMYQLLQIREWITKRLERL